MRGLGLRAHPLLVLLALSQFAAVHDGDVASRLRAIPAEEAVQADPRDETARAPGPRPRRAPSPALRRLLDRAAARWHMP